MITHDTLLRVRKTARIDEVAAGYLTLRRSGKDLVALCPFHDERHPSFRISPALNIGTVSYTHLTLPTKLEV